MEREILNVCLTGAAGQIAYNFLPMLISGHVFGANQKIQLRLLDIPACEDILRGISLEITDCASSIVVGVETGSDSQKLFKDLDVGIFLGGLSRKPGMERKDLLESNANIFTEQGKALNDVARATCKVLVVANPANTNCLILMKNAPKIPKENFTSLTRLDHNRALAQLALKAAVPVDSVRNAILWGGNHATSQYPDASHVKINGKDIGEVIKEETYLKEEYISKVQKRGAEVLSQLKKPSLMSAAIAVRDHLRSWILGTQEGEWVSMGIYSEGHYNVPKDIVFSFPVKCYAGGRYEVVKDLAISEFSKEKIQATAQELLAEKEEAGV